jgi:hypothetical protein
MELVGLIDQILPMHLILAAMARPIQLHGQPLLTCLLRLDLIERLIKEDALPQATVLVGLTK